MGPDTPLDESPAVTPRSTQGPPSEEELAPSQEEQVEKAEPEQPRRKKTGDEPPSRERSPEDHFPTGDQVEVDEEERVEADEVEQVEADEEEQEPSEAAEDDMASGRVRQCPTIDYASASAHKCCMTNIVHRLTTGLMYVIERRHKEIEKQPGPRHTTPCDCDTLT